MGDYEVLWPRSARTAEITELAERPAGLEGKRIAFIWDYLFRGDEIFPILERELRAAVPGVQFVSYEAFGTTHGAGEQDVLASFPERFRELGVDAAISGMGC
ncbi:MAG: hypothetical protein AB7W59_11565 [Acidimicrobiia bacterium]